MFNFWNCFCGAVIEVAIGEYEADGEKLMAAASCLGRNTFTPAKIGTQRKYEKARVEAWPACEAHPRAGNSTATRFR